MSLTLQSKKTPEHQKVLKLDDSTRKTSLVQGELADLEALRKGSASWGAFQDRVNLCWDDVQYSLKITRQNPRILVLSLIVFVILCGGGLGLVFSLAKDQDEEDKDLALSLATETGRWFGACAFVEIDRYSA